MTLSSKLRQQLTENSLNNNNNNHYKSSYSVKNPISPSPPKPSKTTTTTTTTTNTPDINKSNDKSTMKTTDSNTPKHPLRDSWTLWYFKNDKSVKRWEDNLKQVFTFDTIEDFWGLVHYLVPPSSLPIGCDYSLFKTGIAPMWEDPRNRRGGRWLLNLERGLPESSGSPRTSHNNLDRLWLEVLLILVGAQDETTADTVNGAVLNARPKGDKISLWMSISEGDDVIKNVGRRVKDRLGTYNKIVFEVHEDSMKKSGSITKNKYVI